ncbi:MAG: C45 family autoproteolytic acyltransferase/hydrolase [Kofleriaceae bacterium]|nr:C45 family autoproteolytic acyltransferase/hydrolase [Kofleriaceae bacterium]
MADLVIGARRAGVPRPWRAGVIALGMLGVAITVAWFIYRRTVAYEMPDGSVEGSITSVQSAPGAQPSLVYGASALSWTGGIAVLRVKGDAHAQGAAHGRLLAPWLPAVLSAARPSITNTVGREGLIGGRTHGMRLAWRWRFIDDGMSDPDRRIIAGMTRGAEASGVDVSFDELLRTQAVLDVGVPSPRTDEAEHKSLAQSLTIIGKQATAPARVWIGRTLALPGLDDGGDAERPVVTISHSEGKVAWAGVAWPGMTGVVTGINAHGIALMVDPARTADVRPTRTARPIAQLARTVLESATTLDEAIKLIEGTLTLGTAVIIVVDGTSGNWVQIERTPSKAITERNPRSPAFGDVLTTHALSSDPENDRARRMLPTQARVERAAKLLRAPLPDVTAMAAVLRDQRGVDDAPRPSGHRGTIDDGRAVQTVILDPSSLELWVADPTANGRMRAFDLRHELRKEGDRPAPPADVLPDPAADPERTGNLVAARAWLREARGALVDGQLGRAAEACARARVRAPELPEALELEAMIELARGNTSAARKAFEAWLEHGSDDPKGEERARAVLAR